MKVKNRIKKFNRVVAVFLAAFLLGTEVPVLAAENMEQNGEILFGDGVSEGSDASDNSSDDAITSEEETTEDLFADSASEMPQEEVIPNDSSEEIFSSVNTDHIELYAMDQSYQKRIKIPSDYPQEFQIKVTDGETPTFRVIEGDSVVVSEKGVVRPDTTELATPQPDVDGEIQTEVYNFGTSVIQVKSGSKTYEIKATVYDYATIYAESVMDDYLSRNIKDSMTEMEKLDVIAAFPTQYDYDYRFSDYVPMIIMGGGDCWASSYAIYYLCCEVGIEARVRDASGDFGAGSGHENVVVKIDNKYYIVEAGYNEKAPRFYTITEFENIYEYRINEDGKTISLDGYHGTELDIVIPSEIDGYPVTAINGGTFRMAMNLTSVTLPEGLERIEEGTFTNCKKLKHVKIPSTVNYIGEDAFLGSGLVSIDIPTNVTEIGNYAFHFCENLENVNFGSNSKLKKIGSFAFWKCPFKKISIPAGVESIGSAAFGYNQQLISISVPKENKNYSSKDGILFDKKKTTLIQYPDAKEVKSVYRIPDSVKVIGSGSFEHCINLTNIIIPSSVKKIGINAFGCCKNLKFLYFEGGFPEFDPDTFSSDFQESKYIQHIIYYPYYDATWKGADVSNINGSVYWIPYEYLFEPPTITKTVKVNDGIELVWNKIVGAQKYRIYYRVDSGPWKRAGNTKSNKFTWKGAKKGQTYQFTVRCISSDGKRYTSNYTTPTTSVTY